MAKGAFEGESYSFSKGKAYGKLKKLAKNPFDLSEMTPERLGKMQAKSCGFTLLYGTQKVTDEVMEQLYALAMEARVLEKMGVQQAGEVVNYIEGYESDERAVLHTALRDLFDHPNKAAVAEEATELAKGELQKLEAFAPQLDGFTDMLFIGIGGILANTVQHFHDP